MTYEYEISFAGMINRVKTLHLAVGISPEYRQDGMFWHNSHLSSFKSSSSNVIHSMGEALLMSRCQIRNDVPSRKEEI